METIGFWVVGAPIPQGSKSVSRQGFLYEANKKLKPWRKAVAEVAKGIAEFNQFFAPRPEAVEVRICFIMPRPKSTPKKTPHATKRPDIDKLTRSILDSLTGIAWEDDSQVTVLACQKTIAEPSQEPGVYVVVTKL